MEPEGLRRFHTVNARQRVVAVLTAVDTGQRHVPVHLLQQTEPFPDKPDGDQLAGWLSAHHLASRFADAATERIVAEADLRLRFVAVPRLADDFRQAIFTVVAVVPAGLAVILLHSAAVDIIAPANAVQLRQAVSVTFSAEPSSGLPAASQRHCSWPGNVLSCTSKILRVRVSKVCKEEARMPVEGKDYIVKDGDVVNILLTFDLF